jgi:hypothetical protein
MLKTRQGRRAFHILHGDAAVEYSICEVGDRPCHLTPLLPLQGPTPCSQPCRPLWMQVAGEHRPAQAQARLPVRGPP